MRGRPFARTLPAALASLACLAPGALAQEQQAPPPHEETEQKLRSIRDQNMPVTQEIQEKLDKLAADSAAHPEDAMKMAEYGYRLLQVGRLEPGMAQLNRAIALAPNEPKIQLIYARGLWKSKELDEAADAALRAAASPLSSVRDSSEAFRVAGAVRWEQAKTSQAEEYFRSAVKRDPSNTGALSNLGTLLVELKRRAEGVDILEQAVQKGKDDPKQLATIARVFEGIGDLDRAWPVWVRISELVPNDPDVNFIAASHLMQRQSFAEAIVRLERALKVKPADANAHLMYSQALLRVGRYDDAKREAGLAEKLGAGDPARATLDAVEFEKRQSEGKAPK
jgi:tetratricopeptide (TPR) repeat protein